MKFLKNMQITFIDIKTIAVIALSIIMVGCSLTGEEVVKAEDHFQPEMVELIHTIERGNKNKAQALVNQGLDLDIRSEHGLTPLFYFISKKDMEAIELALILGADPNYKAIVYPERGRPWKYAPIIAMAGEGDNKIFELLLKYGADPNTKSSNNQPALFKIISHDNWQQFDLFLKYGGDINGKDSGGRRASMYAVNIMKPDFVLKLIELGDKFYETSNNNGSLGFSIAFEFNEHAVNPEYNLSEEMYTIREKLEERGVIFPKLPFKMKKDVISEVRENMAIQAQSLMLY